MKGKILAEIVYGGHLQCLSAVSVAYISSVLLEIPLGWSALVVIYLIFYPVYLWDRYKGTKEDYLTNRKRTAHIRNYIGYIPYIIGLDLALLVGISYFLSGIMASLIALAVVVVGFAYQSHFKKLTKKIFLFKNIFVALFFSLPIFYYLVYYSAGIVKHLPGLYAVLTLFFLKVFLVQIFYDLKDTKGDRKKDLLTLPVVYGKTNTISILGWGSTLLVGVVVLFYFGELLPASILIAVPMLIYTFYYLAKAKKETFSSYLLSSLELPLWALLVTLVDRFL